MADCFKVMSFSLLKRQNRGAYEQPYSGVGMEFAPLGTPPDRTGLVLHECGYLPDLGDWNFPGVFSPFWRLYYNRSRGHCIAYGDNYLELSPEQLVVVPPHCLFHCLGGNPVPALWLAFSFERRFLEEQDLPRALKPSPSELCLIGDLSERLDTVDPSQPQEAIERLGLALLHLVLARKDLNWRSPLSRKMAAVHQHIERNLPAALDTPSLARAAGLSVSGFNRAFRKTFDRSPAHYIAELRVREAAGLLLHTETSIEDIAERTGFPDRAYFSRVFKKLTSESPAAFRRKHRRPGA